MHFFDLLVLDAAFLGAFALCFDGVFAMSNKQKWLMYHVFNFYGLNGVWRATLFCCAAFVENIFSIHYCLSEGKYYEYIS